MDRNEGAISQHSMPSIINNNLMKADQMLTVDLDQEHYLKIHNVAKRNCKILKISTKRDLGKLEAFLKSLKIDEFLQLFIFIIEVENLKLSKSDPQEAPEEIIKNIQKWLLEFSKSRPMILQLSLKNEKVTRFYCKEESVEEFEEIDINISSEKEQTNFKSFLPTFLRNETEAMKMITYMLMDVQDTLLLRFLRALKLPGDSLMLLKGLIPECAEKYTPKQLMALLDAPFENVSHMLSAEAQEWLSVTIKNYKNSENGSVASQNDQEHVAMDEDEKAADEKSESDQMDGNVKNKPNFKEHSVLSVAISSKKTELVDFLIENFSHLFEQLPHDHKIEISTAAHPTHPDNSLSSTDALTHLEMIRILSNLIQFYDFPFPSNFDSNDIKNDKTIQKLADERDKFHAAIEAKNFEEIENFINSNMNAKVVYGTDNKSALCKALKTKQYEVFFHLLSRGFKATEFDDHNKELNENEQKEAKKFEDSQVEKNVKFAVKNVERTVKLLIAKSRIHNIKMNAEKQKICHQQIKKFFSELYASQRGSNRILLDVIAQCEDLIFVFDFESELVANLNFSRKSSGVTRHSKKWIFIGAKGWEDKRRQQKIKGTMAHEMCHYVMFLIFENNTYPFDECDLENGEKYKKILGGIHKLIYGSSNIRSTRRANDIDDKCNEILSRVFECYDKEDDHLAELIVRIPEIFAYYDDNPSKVDELEVLYKSLFEFYNDHVVPKMKAFDLKKRKSLNKFNKIAGHVSKIDKLDIKILKPKNFEEARDIKKDTGSAVVTNIPRLLLLDYKKSYSGTRTDSIYITSDDLKKPSTVEELEDIQGKNKNSKILVHCMEAPDINILKKFDNLILVTIDENLAKTPEEKTKFQLMSINYDRKDIKLIKYDNLPKVCFQNDSKTSISNLLFNECQSDVEKEIIFNEVVDDELLNLLLEEASISINTEFHGITINSQFFKYINKKRKHKSPKSPNLITQEELIKNTKGQKFILISDIAGNGKSCALKSIAVDYIKTSDGTWVTYVDLKKFIEAFKSLKDKPEFLTFMVEHVLKGRKDFESKMFTKLYQKGKVVVFFDGFDEISPNYAETVVKIIKSFEMAHDGNKMWIATRDYFEIDLQKQLGLDSAYKLEDFTKEDGAEMIAKSWILHDSELQKLQVKSAIDLKQFLNFEPYQTLAKDLIFKLSTSWFGSIGFPQLYKMIAEVSKDNKTAALDMNNFGIYQKFVQIQIKRWSHDKGAVREEACVNALNKGISFSALHQFAAMKNYFPDEVDFCGLTFDKDEWSDGEVVACGLITKNGENFYFPHETFQEFFAAEFIVNAFRKGQQEVVKFFIEFMTLKKYQIIRMFMDGALADEGTSKAVKTKIQNSSKKFNEKLSGKEKLFENFNENLPNLLDFLINLLSSIEYEKVKKILNSNIEKIIENANHSASTIKIQEFFIQFLNVDDLKELLLKHNYLIDVTRSCEDVEVLKHFVTKIEEKFKNDEEKGKEFLKKLFMMKVGWHKNILHACVLSGRKEVLELLWQKVENLIENENFKESAKRKCKFNDKKDCNILQIAAKCKSLDFHETLWKFLLKTFDDREELKEIVLEKDKDEFGRHVENFIHIFARQQSNTNTNEFTLKILKENFSNDQIQEILMSKGGWERRNMLQLARSENNFSILWKFYRNFFESDQKMLLEVMSESANSTDYRIKVNLSFLTSEIFKFIIKEVGKVETREGMRKMLSGFGDRCNRNLLQIAVMFNESEEFHESLWKVFGKYFGTSEILKFLRHKDKKDENYFQLAAKNENCEKILKIAQNELKKMESSQKSTGNELADIISQCETALENLGNLTNEKLNRTYDFYEQKFTFHFTKVYKIIINDDSISLEELTSINDIEVHKSAWDQQLQQFTDRQELKNLLIKFKFPQLLLAKSQPDIIKFTFGKFKEISSDEQVKELSRSKDSEGRNLLHILVAKEKDFGRFEAVWNSLKELIGSVNVSFTEMIMEVASDSSNILHIAAQHSTAEILKFLVSEMEKMEMDEEVKKFLKSLTKESQNVLQIAAWHNKTVPFHASLWKVIRKHFTESEVIELVKQTDEDGRNLLHAAVVSSEKEVVEFLWNEIENSVTSKSGLVEIISQRDKENKNILHACVLSENKEVLEFLWQKVENLVENENFKELAKQTCKFNNTKDCSIFHMAAECKSFEFYETLWKLLLITFDNREELKEMILEKYKFGENFVHKLAKEQSNTDIIEFTLKILKENFSNDQIQEILMSKDRIGRNILQLAVGNSEHIKKIKFLWKFHKNYFEPNQKFMEVIKEVDRDNQNILHIAVAQPTSEIFNFLIAELEKVGTLEEMRKMLSQLGRSNRNLLQIAAWHNKSLELHESLWKIFEKYFEHSDIFEFIKHIDNWNQNLIQLAVERNTAGIANFTWNKIKNFLDYSEQIKCLTTRDGKGRNSYEISCKKWTNPEEMKKFVEKLFEEFSLPLK